MKRRRTVPCPTHLPAALVATTLLLLPLPVTAGQEAAPGSLATDLVVRVTNETGAPIAGQEVFVVVSTGQEVAEELTATTTEDGSARFEGVQVGSGYTARAISVFEGYPYQGDAVPLAAGVESSLPLTVYTVDEGSANLHIDVLHIILNVVEPGVYQALQVMSVLNVGERASYSGEEFDGRRIGMVIPVPAGAASVTPVPQISGLDPARLAQDGDRLLDLRPVPPGNHQIAVQYEILTGVDGGDVDIRLPYPTAQISMLVGPGLGVIVVESDQLQELDPVEIPGQGEYANFTSDVIAAGDTLRFRIGPPQAPMSIASWALLALAIALAASAAASIFLGSPASSDPAERDGLIAEVARLDAQHDGGALGDTDYQALRGAAIARLMELDGRTGTGPGPHGD